MFEIVVVGEGHVRLVGRLDAAQADTALAALSAVRQPMVADCAELDYISSAGIGIIVETHKRLTLEGHSLRLVQMNARVRNIFTYAGLDRLLQIE